MKHQILLVDGYNMIGAWPELAALKNQEKLEDARDRLLNILSNYAKFEGIEVIVVFDAQFVPGIQKEYKKYLLTVIFTKTDETADSYIEKKAGELNNRLNQVTVATSDLAEQWLIFSKGALRKSANELYKDVKQSDEKIYLETRKYQYDNYRKNTPWSLEELKTLEDLRDNLSR